VDDTVADVAPAAAVDPHVAPAPAADVEPKRRKRPHFIARELGRAAFFALMVATAATLLARWNFFADIVCSFRWQAGWWGLGIAALLVLFRMRVLGAIAFAASVFLLAPVVKPYLASRDPRGEGPTLRVVTANVFFGNNDVDGMRAWLLDDPPDVLAIQELPHTWREDWRDLSAAYPREITWPSSLRDWDDVGFGIALFTHLPVVSSRVVRLRPESLPMLEVVVRVGDRDVTVRTMHPTSPQTPSEWAQRNVMLACVAHEVAWNDDCVLLADFNTSSGSPQFADLIEAARLRDSRRGFGRLPTWQTEWLIRGLWVDLDHILVGNSLRVLARDTDHIPGSDHRAARATLVLRGDPKAR
jgi:endonuclease/exonuclease/phosphatase (EEP) superfamily protein YafD